MIETIKEKRVIMSLDSQRDLSQDMLFFTFKARLFQLYILSKSQCDTFNSYRDIQKTTLDITPK